jgi:hypothetical protein
MVSNDNRAVEFAPLRGFDADDAEEAFQGGDLEDGVAAATQPDSRRGLARAA